MPSATLSERERKFVHAFKGDANGNLTKAAIAAGYSQKSAARQGFRLSKRAHVIAALGAIQATLNAKAMLTAEDVEQELDAVIRSAPDKPPTFSEKLKAIELKGKRLKMWDEKHGESRVTVNIGFLTAATSAPRTIQVLSQRAQVLVSGEPGSLHANTKVLMAQEVAGESPENIEQ